MKRLLLSLIAGILAVTVLTACGEIKEEYKVDEDWSERAGNTDN
ncbi:hypothetical protein ACJ2A9_18660 [Anaerobacillus sp. MEB173]